MVTFAEFVWQRSEEEFTQQEIASMLAWSREKVAQYAQLRKIDDQAWQVVVTTFEGTRNNSDEEVVTQIVTGVTFSEYMLRDILKLTAEQQLELVTELATV